MKCIKDAEQSGFTIIELMIATIVSSVILLVITYGVVSFSNAYYHGVNASNTQSTTQNAVDAITHAIEFNAGQTTAVSETSQTGVFCAGSQIFLYDVGKQLKTAPADGNWGLYQINNPSATCVKPTDPDVLSSGTELLGKNMRIAYLSLTQLSCSVWNLNLRIVYGDTDLLCDNTISSGPGSCRSGAAPFVGDTVQGDGVTCKLQTGSQFCSVARLGTSIGQRISN
jgi:prepilin-type N-terminal cleavage/methylation domain-containing protein